jgi:hypothetical protein
MTLADIIIASPSRRPEATFSRDFNYHAHLTAHNLLYDGHTVKTTQ